MTSRAVQIRQETWEDVAAISDVLASAFPTSEEAALVDQIRANGHLSVSLVAEVSGHVVGHIAFSPVTIGDRIGVGLAPLAVLASHRRQGVGADLVEAGLALCKQAGFPFAVVLGEPAYYARFGFWPASTNGISDEFGGGDAFAIVELIEGGIPSQGGLARYASEFDVFRMPE